MKSRFNLGSILQMMNTMGGDGLPDLEGGDEEVWPLMIKSQLSVILQSKLLLTSFFMLQHGVADSGDGSKSNTKQCSPF